MFRRAMILTGLVSVLGVLAGCQSHLPKTWTFSEFREHAERLDVEFGWLHADIKDNFFGIENYRPPVVWQTYEP